MTPNRKHDMRSDEQTAQKPLKAFEVDVKGCPEVTSIYGAETASQAKYKAWSAAKDAGYDLITFGMFRVRRAPEFDSVSEKLKQGMDRTGAHLILSAMKRQGKGETKREGVEG